MDVETQFACFEPDEAVNCFKQSEAWICIFQIQKTSTLRIFDPPMEGFESV